MERDILATSIAHTINHLFGIREIFKRRGRTVTDTSRFENILFELPSSGFSAEHYNKLGSSSFRRVIGLIANSVSDVDFENVVGQCSDLDPKRVKLILEEGIELKMIKQINKAYKPSKDINFGPTFEWYIAKVCEKELASYAHWGVKVKGLSGDYDVVVIRENQIGYIECKSGKFSNITKDEIKNFLIRERALAPQFSIFLGDKFSQNNIERLVDWALKEKESYNFGITGIMNREIPLARENYKNFIRLIPINSFFVSIRKSVPSTLREIYEFLTTVCDRNLPVENIAAKSQYFP